MADVLVRAGKTPTKPAPKAAEPRARAQRMAPEARRLLILDSAEKLVAARGVARITLEAVAEAAKVSKPLVYKYFPSIDALVEALLQREFDIIRGRKLAPVDPDTAIEDVLRIYVRRYLEYLSERGDLFLALASHARSKGAAGGTARAQRSQIMKFWTDRIMAAYGLPLDLAEVGVIMTTAAVEGAQGSVRRGKVDVARTAEFWTTFVEGGWAAASKRYGHKPVPQSPKTPNRK